jgi:hypothetical protein
LSLNGELSEARRYLLRKIENSILGFENKIFRLEERLFKSLGPHQKSLDILETVPGQDIAAAIMLLVKIGPDMKAFRSAERLVSWSGFWPATMSPPARGKAK